MWFKRTIRDRGPAAEAAARHHLEMQGLIFLEQNYRCKLGEIDLIMQDEQTLVFIEVRYRKNLHYGSTAESVDPRKQQRIITTANHYLQTRVSDKIPRCRFDVVALWGQKQENIEWIKDAFQSSW